MKTVMGILGSKTMWINALTMLVGYSGLLPSNKYTLVGLAAANLLLRLLTNQPVVFTDPKPTVPAVPVV